MYEIIYRPEHKSEKEIENDFVIRLLEYDKLMDSINSDQTGKTPQHIIIQGQRGMGKTTLMYRVYYQVLKERRKKGLVPVIFSEEQYGIRTLYKLWEQIALYLEDNEPDEYSGIWYEIQEIRNEDNYEEVCFGLLLKNIKRNNHRLLLLVDNFGMMVNKFQKKEQQRFREILTTFPEFKIIGGSTVVVESFYKYDKPFFDFFKIIHLNPLNSKEVRTLLARLGEKHKADHIKRILKDQPGRVESMRILTGGVPRTIVLLFDIFLDSDKGNSIEDLKQLLDMVTPLYKHRMDDLPAQQQEIVDKLALNWDGMSVSELVSKTRMESKALSAQLNLLEKSGIVSSEKSSNKNKYYQLEERFFNIWYLMHHAPKSNQRKVIWLTRFLEFWCTGKILEETALAFTGKLKKENMHPGYIEAMTWAYSRAQGLSLRLRDDMIEAAKESLKKNKNELICDLPVKYNDLIDQLEKLTNEKKYPQAISLVEHASIPDDITNFLLGFINNSLGKFKGAEKYYLIAVKKDNVHAMFNIALLYENHYKDYNKAIKYYLMAVEKGNDLAMLSLALLYDFHYKDYDKAEKYYLMAIKKGNTSAIHNFLNFIISFNKTQYVNYSGSWVNKLLKSKPDNKSSLMVVRYNIWINKIEDATKYLEEILPGILKDEKVVNLLSDVLAFAVAKGLKNYTFNLFNQEKYELKDRLKVVYYALMKLMEKEYPNEIKKMGKELEEPVNFMIEYIKSLEEKYV